MNIKDKEWDNLLSHERHVLKFGAVPIIVEDGVFTPNPDVTYSTSMILDNLPDVQGKRIADVGTGTGVLAVISALKGAQEVFATDTSDLAIKNAKENIEKNDASNRIQLAQCGLLEEVPGDFDYIFANLPILDSVWGTNTESILETFLKQAKNKLTPGGKVYLTWASFGEDRAKLEDLITQNDFNFNLKQEEHVGHLWYLYILSRE